MKNLFLAVVTAGVVLHGSLFNSFGATAKSASYDPNYHLGENGMYYQLGFGTRTAMLSFMTNQVIYLDAGIWQEDGTGGFEMPAVVYEYFPESETLEEATLRIGTAEFQRLVQKRQYRTNQKFSIKFHFLNELSEIGGQFFSQKVSFTPVQAGTEFVLPSDLPSRLVLNPVFTYEGGQTIYWPNILCASLTVLGSKGELIYSGDSRNNKFGDTNMYVAQNLYLEICSKLTTNGYRGVLTVALKDGTTSSYHLEDGTWAYPGFLQPILRPTMNNGKFELKIFGGGANMPIRIDKYTALGCAPQEPILKTLDCVGSLTVTDDSPSNSAFFSVSYYGEAARKP